MRNLLRLGLIAPKNTPAEQRWLLSFLRDVKAEPYRRGHPYDLVWFVNVTDELRWLKAHTDTRAFVICMEPKGTYPMNYEPALLKLADSYLGYQNFAGEDFHGMFHPLVFPAYPIDTLRQEFPVSLQAHRDHSFCIMATHDPNCRKALATAAGAHGCLAAGPLFGARFDDKLAIQRQARFELITENDINDYYVSEKISASLLAGCVPVYYGGASVSSLVPADLFVDLRRFVDPRGTFDAEAAVSHCMTPGVYEGHAAAIRETGLALLLSKFSVEGCLTDPVQAWIRRMNDLGWRARRTATRFHEWQVQSIFGGRGISVARRGGV